jgi:site-specific DNA-cytosine methylase
MRHRYTVFHLFSGIGGGALGFQASKASLGSHKATFHTLGGLDSDEGAARDFERLVGAPCLVRDARQVQPAELRALCGDRAPDMVLSSPPCRSYSALLPVRRAAEPEYQELGQLALVGIHLVLATWDPPPRVLFIENVPRIRSRGKDMLASLRRVLISYGYRIAEGVHDCGQVGGLAQHRRRWFLVARHEPSLPRVVYQPPKRRVRGCGEVLDELPVPLDGTGGPMHALPKISRLSWVRLALIPPGGDWRDLPGVVPEGKERREVHRRHQVLDWTQPTSTVNGAGSNGVCNLADPRIALAQTLAGAAAFKGRPGPVQAVTAGMQVTGSNTPAAIGDPRVRRFHAGVLGVQRWAEPAATVTGGAAPSRGAFSVADPRLGCEPRAGVYGVLGWGEPARTISAHQCIDNGTAAVADPRAPTPSLAELLDGDPSKPPHNVPIILALDGTWHRPLTTLELARLQGFPARLDNDWLTLGGRSTTAWRKRIGNAIPPPSAECIGSQMLRAMLAADLDARAELELDQVWVHPSEHGAVVA